jgi:glycosidase
VNRKLLIVRLCTLGLSVVTAALPGRAQPAPPPKGASLSRAALRHTFVYRSAQPLKSVAVAGSFNNWDRAANPMTADFDGRTWRTQVTLPLGKHSYKFVLNGETWITDPAAARNEDDGNGNRNSVLLLTPPDYARAASPRDGVIARSALLHPRTVPYLNYDRGQLTVSLRTRPGDLRQVFLLTGKRRIPMTVTSTDELYARYSANIPWDRGRDLAYSFVLTDGPKTVGFGAAGVGAAGSVTPFRLTAKQFTPFIVPSWVERTVFYQIFPDRFANGDPSNDPPDVQPWDAAPTFGNRLGGDVQGVRGHLPYLASLGISSVYFNPVFKSPSNHRYDAEDYKTIDPQFGTNAQFSALTRELQAKGIRTVMDFVFNHTATSFAPFADIRAKGEASPFKDWYFIKSYPVRVEANPNYVGWFNHPSMPKLNLRNGETREYMLNLVNYWKREVPLAGLRLDVANEVEMDFWRDLRRRTKGLDPQMWIVGEVWGDGAPWLTGDQWDSKMNYEFLWPNRDFIAEGKIPASAYAKRLMAVYSRYVPQVSRNMMNLLSSHDTPRFLTVCGNNEELHRLAATVQLTWVGAPSIYYGEELGMRGGADPANRRGMEWSRATPENPMLRHYRRLIALRNASPALQSGDPRILMTDDAHQSLAYSRTLGNEVAIIAVNRGRETRTLTIPLPAGSAVRASLRSGLVEGLTGKRLAPPTSTRSLTVSLPPLRAAVYLPANERYLAIAAP